MPKVCVLPFCKMREPTQGVRFFRISSIRRELWLPALGRNVSDTLSVHNVVCSLHFSKENFLKSGLLKKNAVPTLRLKPKKPTLVSSRLRLEHWFQVDEPTQLGPVEETLALPSTETLCLPVPQDSENISDQENAISIASTSSIEIKYPPVKKTGNREQSCFSDSGGLLGSDKKRRHLMRQDHPYRWRPKKKMILRHFLRTQRSLRKKINLSKRKMDRITERIRNLLTEFYFTLMKQRLTSDEAQAIKKNHVLTAYDHFQ